MHKELNNACCKSEWVFAFEKYVTKLSGSFEILCDHDVGKQEREKVDILLNGIQSDNQIVISAKTMVWMQPNMRMSFQEVVNCLSELIGVTMTSHNSKSGCQPSRRVGLVKCKRGGGMDWVIANGVDITDPHRNFPQNKWFKIPQEKHKWIQKKHAEKKEAKCRKLASANTDHQDGQQMQQEAQGQGQG